MITKSKYIITIIIAVMMVTSSSDISLSSDDSEIPKNKIDFFKPVIDRLISLNADTSYIYDLINDNDTEFDERFVRINVTGYLKATDYSGHYNAKSVNKTKEFIRNNYGILALAESKFGVPKEVIASVLWVETRHGSYLGNNHVASVYLSTAMCNEPVYLNMNIQNLKDKFNGSENELNNLIEKIKQRSIKKSNWALEQLLALEKIDKLPYLSSNEIRGSWAGAFGISQFIPTSYVTWAVDGNGDGKIDLFNVTDAVFSVANYLKSNGWDLNDESRRAAVFHYNNSNAYVDAVLKLAEFSQITNDSLDNQYLPLNVIQAQSGSDESK